MNKLADIQKLRALAILMVIFGHMPLTLPAVLLHGYTGVTLFFVISGYVVTLSFTGREQAHQPKSDRDSWRLLRDFYVRRIFRIVPVMVFWVAASVAIVEFASRTGYALPWSVPRGWRTEIGWMLTGAYNYQFAAAGFPAIFGHYWSLAVEMHFYLILPIIFLIARSREVRVAAFAAAAVAVALILRPATPVALAGFLTHSQADAMLVGVVLCLLFSGARGNWRPAFARGLRIGQWQKNLFVAALATALFVSPYFMDGPVLPSIKYPWYTLLATTLVFLGQRNTGWVFGGNKVLDGLLGYLGDRSYSYYLCHPVLWFGLYGALVARYAAGMPQEVWNGPIGTSLQAVVLFALAMVAADLSYRLIERPFIRLGKALIAPSAARSRRTPAVRRVPVKEPAPEGAAGDSTN